MPIPTTRNDLLEQVSSAFEKFDAEMDKFTPESSNTICIDDWSVKDVVAIRLWWTQNVLNWIAAGIKGETPQLPAPGYQWNETPRLNNEIKAKAKNQDYKQLVKELRGEYARLLETVATLSDQQLLEVGVFSWAGRYPISRWLSINTTRQYTTARTYLRRIQKVSITRK